MRPGHGRRISTRWKLAVLLAGLFAFGCSRPEARPNIVFILIDTLRGDVLAGNAPHLEELGRDGVSFDRVIAPSSWTKTSM
jgi:membrane-anchored protein YejM (alkaline phosphatase superfamily)